MFFEHDPKLFIKAPSSCVGAAEGTNAEVQKESGIAATSGEAQDPMPIIMFAQNTHELRIAYWPNDMKETNHDLPPHMQWPDDGVDVWSTAPNGAGLSMAMIGTDSILNIGPCNIAVSVREGVAQFRRTKVVTISPHHHVINRLGYPIRCMAALEPEDQNLILDAAGFIANKIAKQTTDKLGLSDK